MVGELDAAACDTLAVDESDQQDGPGVGKRCGGRASVPTATGAAALDDASPADAE